jgi:curved DNA-binding protein CbpA
MAPDADPYRTLGLIRGATLDDVKRAYRQLAKENHPDAAGEAALPRFLAIQAAYEQLIGGSATSGKGRRAASSPRRPWEAGPDQGDATRRAYGGRARNTQPGGSGAGPRPAPGPGPGGTRGASGGQRTAGAAGARPPGSAGGTTGGTTGRPGRPGRGGTAGPRRTAGGSPDDPTRGTKGRPSNKATFGSTSYDGADAGPFEPDWGGASWYGTTSGTYWTLNPKEYADPRKHGPEYQARARRAARARAGTGAADGTPGDETHADTAADPAAHARPGDPTHTTTSWWDSTAGPDDSAAGASFAGAAANAGGRGGPGDAPSSPAMDDPPPPDLGRAVADIARALTDDRFGGVRGRLVRAIIGWLPIALGLGWIVGESTGCGRFAASCDGATEPILLAVQVAVFVVLLVVPAIASVATTAALALFAAAVVASLILSATGGAADSDAGRTVLGVVLLLGWLAGLAIAIVRRARTLRTTTSPVS